MRLGHVVFGADRRRHRGVDDFGESRAFGSATARSHRADGRRHRRRRLGHELRLWPRECESRGARGNAGASSALPVTVQNLTIATTAVQITWPLDHTIIQPHATLQVTAEATGEVTRIQLYVDVRLVAQSKSASARFRLNTRKLRKGTH